MSLLSVVLKDIALVKIKDAFSKKNVNPVKSPTTCVSYTSSGALAYLLANPPGTEHDVYMQAVAAVISLVTFFYNEHKEKDK